MGPRVGAAAPAAPPRVPRGGAGRRARTRGPGARTPPPRAPAPRPRVLGREPLGAGPDHRDGHARAAAEILPFDGRVMAEEREQLRLLPLAQLGAARERARALGRHVALLDPVG